MVLSAEQERRCLEAVEGTVVVEDGDGGVVEGEKETA